uniref:Retrotransposon protein, putative, unclassified n=1 Tax=Tanacetum cinerariifolium TaxID=118510 RepID=A0A6L2JYP6_TANCI|nr:retrotransposon protein, putative, unclassified [Tanacetum cinerariifolium]
MFQQGEDLIECINKAMAFLSVVASRFPPLKNQLRTSSNPRIQATIQDGRVIVQQVYGRRHHSYAGTGNRGIATTSKGNVAAGPSRVEKLMLAEAQEAGQILDEGQLAFLADLNCDDLSSTKVVLMANLSSCDPEVFSEVPYSDSYPNDMINQDVQEMQSTKETHVDDFEDNEIHSGSNIIPYSQYLQETQDAVIQDTNPSAPNDLLVLSLVEQMTNHTAHLDKKTQTNKIKDSVENVKKDIDEIETINIELGYSVTKLLSKNENLRKEPLKNELRNTKGKNIVNHVVSKPNATLTLEMFKLNIKPISARLNNNRDAHEKLLVYASQTCPNSPKPSAKLVVVTPVNKDKRVRFAEPATSSNNIPKQTNSPKTKDSNKPLLTSTGIIPTTRSNAIDVPSSSSLVNDMLSRSNNQVAKIIGYGDYQQGNVIISRVYYVEGLRHNLFSVGQFCDADLEVAFRKNTYFIWNLEGVDLLSGSHDTNLYTISLNDMLMTSSICLLSKALKTKSWLWHHHLSHLNFGTLNKLAKDGLSRVPVAAAPRVVEIADSAVSTSIDQDAPSSSIPLTQDQEHSPIISQGVKESPKTPLFHHNPLYEFLHEDSTSQGSSSNEHPSHVYKLKKALYGLKQAPRAWYDMLSSFLISKHLSKGAVDQTLFTQKAGNDLLRIQIYVDDIIFASTNTALCNEFANQMTTKFKMSMMGKMSLFLGLPISQSPRGIFLNQSRYAYEIIKKYGLLPSDFVDTHMVEKNKLDDDLRETPVDATLYRAYSDADHTGCHDTRHSASGSTQFLDYGFQFNKIPLYRDNKSVIALCCNNVQHSRAKHIDVRCQFIKEQVANRIVELYFVWIEYQLDDIFTKPLPSDRFNFLIEKLSMESMSSEMLKRLIEEDGE